MIKILIIIGIATWYGGLAQPQYVGQPLYCDCDGTLLYEPRETVPWVALDVAWFESGAVSCGDDIELRFWGGPTIRARALDAGPFSLFYVEDYTGLPIVADLPAHLWPLGDLLSAPVTLINRTELARVLNVSLSDEMRQR